MAGAGSAPCWTSWTASTSSCVGTCCTSPTPELTSKRDDGSRRLKPQCRSVWRSLQTGCDGACGSPNGIEGTGCVLPELRVEETRAGEGLCLAGDANRKPAPTRVELCRGRFPG